MFHLYKMHKLLGLYFIHLPPPQGGTLGRKSLVSQHTPLPLVAVFSLSQPVDFSWNLLAHITAPFLALGKQEVTVVLLFQKNNKAPWVDKDRVVNYKVTPKYSTEDPGTIGFPKTFYTNWAAVENNRQLKLGRVVLSRPQESLFPFSPKRNT